VAARYGEEGTFVVTVFLGAEQVRRQLRGLGCRNVLPFYPLFWRHPEELLPHYAYDLPQKLLAARDQVRRAWLLLADDASRREYLAQVRWRLDPEAGNLPPAAEHPIYFPPELFALRQDELFVDCGGYDGDTLRSFLGQVGSRLCGAVVFEPDPENFRRLMACARAQPAEVAARLELHQAAVGAARAVLRLDTRGSAASSLSGAGDLDVACRAIDEVVGERAATFVKMDIEGAELEAIAGARRQIQLHRPLLALSAYHCQDHLWRLPIAVHKLNAGYRFFLRRYSPEAIDALVLYAVPAGRLSDGWGSTQ
jgi:FkbM family methyltransferase